MTDLYDHLSRHRIPYERYDHPPVYTVQDVKESVPELAAVRTKNLFVRDEKGKRHLLIVSADDKRIDLKAAAAAIPSSRLSFASPERLRRYLGVDPGAVSLFALVNDVNHEVEVIIDKELWSADAFQFHPLVNTSTLVISRADVERFAASTGHTLRIVDLPG